MGSFRQVIAVLFSQGAALTFVLPEEAAFAVFGTRLVIPDASDNDRSFTHWYSSIPIVGCLPFDEKMPGCEVRTRAYVSVLL